MTIASETRAGSRPARREIGIEAGADLLGDQHGQRSARRAAHQRGRDIGADRKRETPAATRPGCGQAERQGDSTRRAGGRRPGCAAACSSRSSMRPITRQGQHHEGHVDMNQRHHRAEFVGVQRQRLLDHAPLDQERVDDAPCPADGSSGEGATTMPVSMGAITPSAQGVAEAGCMRAIQWASG